MTPGITIKAGNSSTWKTFSKIGPKVRRLPHLEQYLAPFCSRVYGHASPFASPLSQLIPEGSSKCSLSLTAQLLVTLPSAVHVP